MPKIVVEIEYDQPDDPYWLNPDNVAICLHEHCKDTKFHVSWARNGNPWPWREQGRVKEREENNAALDVASVASA